MVHQSVEDRKNILENVMKAAEGKLTVIAHVACNNTKDSQELAKHAESLGVDAIAAIPPIYFHLPEYAIAKYWNDISAAAPHTDFVIYNIPCRCCFNTESFCRDEKKSECDWREKLIHASSGYSDVQTGSWPRLHYL